MLFAFAALTAQAGLSPLEAISMIESGNNDSAVGDAGEVSRYQIRPHVWHQFSVSTDYSNAGVAANVAERHLAWLENYFRDRTGRTPDDFDRYVLWNAGPRYYSRIAFSKDRVHPIVKERAQRYVNLREMPDLKTVAVVRQTAAAQP
jgi:hypothetical protein